VVGLDCLKEPQRSKIKKVDRPLPEEDSGLGLIFHENCLV
jgi:hypothetical protein